MVLDIEASNTFEPAVSGDYWNPEGPSDPREHHIGMLDALALCCYLLSNSRSFECVCSAVLGADVWICCSREKTQIGIETDSRVHLFGVLAEVETAIKPRTRMSETVITAGWSVTPPSYRSLLPIPLDTQPCHPNRSSSSGPTPPG